MRKKFDLKIKFTNGDFLFSQFNAQDEQEVKDYYLNRIFNIGSVNDNLQLCNEVEILGSVEINY